jgi:hypothetical protein
VYTLSELQTHTQTHRHTHTRAHTRTHYTRTHSGSTGCASTYAEWVTHTHAHARTLAHAHTTHARTVGPLGARQHTGRQSTVRWRGRRWRSEDVRRCWYNFFTFYLFFKKSSEFLFWEWQWRPEDVAHDHKKKVLYISSLHSVSLNDTGVVFFFLWRGPQTKTSAMAQILNSTL